MCDDLCSFSCLVGSYDMINSDHSKWDSEQALPIPPAVGGTYGDRGIKFPPNNNALNVTDTSNNIHGVSQSSDQSSSAADGIQDNRDNINFKPIVDLRNTSDRINSLTEDGTCESMTNKYSRFTSKLHWSDTSECISPSSFEKWKKEYSNNSLLRQIMASSLGTCVSVLTLNPMSVVKLRLQRQDIFMETTVQGAFRTIYKKDGIRGFWAGSRIGLIQSVPSSVIYMTIYEKLKSELAQNSNGGSANLIPGIAGGLARFYSATLIAPVEIIKTIQTGGRKETAITIARHIYRNGGILGFYRGWSSTIMRDVPFSFFYWVSYERLKVFYKGVFQCEKDISFSERLFSNIGTVTNAESSQNSNIHRTDTAGVKSVKSGLPEYSIFLTFLSGSTSGVVAALVTHPFDVLKTQQQLRTSEQLIKKNNAHNINTCNYNYINNFNTIINEINKKDKYTSGAHNSLPSEYSTSKKPIKSSSNLINSQIFSSNNAYNVRLGVVEIEKISHRTLCLSSMREAYANFTSYFTTSTNITSTEICKRFFPLERDGLVRIIREKGVGGLFKGLNMRLLTVIPSSAIMVTVYEFVKKIDL